jgi:hypothetical protein
MAGSFDEDEPSMERHIKYNKRGELRMVGEKSLFDLDEPVWHADEKSPVCDKCSTPFTFTHRRHHCRRCGEVMCADCMDKVILTRMRYVDPVVVCKTCIPVCKAEEEFFKTHLEKLIAGAYFHLSDSPDLDIEYMCKLGTDHRQIIISNGHLPINMRQILEVKTLQGEAAATASVEEVDGVKKKRSGSNPKSISLELTYRSGGLEHKIILSPATTHSRKYASDWLKALKKALIILHSPIKT